MNGTYFFLASSASLSLLGVRYWIVILQQNTTAIAITLAVVSMLLFFTLVGAIVGLMIQNNRLSGVNSRRPDYGSGLYQVERPTLYQINGYRKLFLALEDALNFDGVKDLIFKLDLDIEFGSSVTKSVLLREVFLELERQGKMGLLYMLVGNDEDYNHVKDLFL